MTAIRGGAGIAKRPGELGIHSMDAFHMAAPDLEVALIDRLPHTGGFCRQSDRDRPPRCAV